MFEDTLSLLHTIGDVILLLFVDVILIRKFWWK
jgi:hypothetical protein